MMRALRAFVWLRWRLVLNALRGGRRRDTLEQISRVFSMVVPFMLIALAFGSVVGLAVVGFFGGRALATGLLDPVTAVGIGRVALFVVTVILVIFSVTSPVQSSLTHYTRLLLLPISKRTLHLIEVIASLTDPWIAFLAPGLLLVAVGLSVGGRTVAAVWAAVAALLFLVLLAAMASAIGFLVAWLLRDRRRSEWLTLAFVMGMSVVGFLPILLAEQSATTRREARQRGEPRPERSFAALDRALPAWTVAVPSELYGRVVRDGLEGRNADAGTAAAALAIEAGLLLAASAFVHGRLIGATTVSGRRRRGDSVLVSNRSIPGLSPAVSAVAIAQARTAMRSVRGRLLVFISGPILAVMVFVFRRFDEVPLFARVGDLGFVLAALGTLMAMLSAQAFSMNLFGSDRAGLTLQFLSPVSDAELARGKILGIGAIVAAATGLAVLAAVIVAPGGAPGLWLAALLGAASVYLAVSPVAVWMSALFPVASDLNRTGQGGNPHGLSAIVGMISLVVASAVTGGIFWVTVWVAGRPGVVLPVMAVWLVVVGAIAHPLVVLASRAVSMRRENLSLVAQGK